jgi:hypothetical protein
MLLFRALFRSMTSSYFEVWHHLRHHLRSGDTVRSLLWNSRNQLIRRSSLFSSFFFSHYFIILFHYIYFTLQTTSLFGKSSTKFSFSFYFSQKYQIKNILTFLYFLHHINNFLLLFNQKNPLQNKTFSLFYKTFSNFLSHQSFLTTIQINILIHNHLPNKPNMSSNLTLPPSFHN